MVDINPESKDVIEAGHAEDSSSVGGLKFRSAMRILGTMHLRMVPFPLPPITLYLVVGLHGGPTSQKATS